MRHWSILCEVIEVTDPQQEINTNGPRVTCPNCGDVIQLSYDQNMTGCDCGETTVGTTGNDWD
jgi:hypothetical protein